MLHKLTVALLGLVLVTTPIQAQNLSMIIETDCSSISEVRSYLKDQYGESAFTSAPGIFKRFDGELAEGLFRTYLNPKEFTFTITVEFPSDDIACVIAMGDEFAPVVHEETPL